MTSRDTILSRVGSAVRHERAHPGSFVAARDTGPPSLWSRFEAALREAGGESVGPVERTDLAGVLHDLCAGSGRVVTGLAELGEGPWEALDVALPPHSFADVEVAMLRGSLAVAENGAVALDGVDAPVRALPFLCQQLILIVDLDRVVADMHVAVARMPADATASHHFTWISGPSKTADIEQTLVIGAQGPRSLRVVGVRSG